MISTERLRLRPLTDADTDWWVHLHADEEVNRFVGSYTEDQAAARLHVIQQQWEQRGYGLCAVELRSTGEAVGRCGLNWWDELGETEIGWTLARAHWGRGYATEAAQAILTWGFGSLGLKQITAMIHHGNTASTTVAKRLGFTPLREDTLLGRPCTVYALAQVDLPPQVGPVPLLKPHRRLLDTKDAQEVQNGSGGGRRPEGMGPEPSHDVKSSRTDL